MLAIVETAQLRDLLDVVEQVSGLELQRT